MIYFKKILVQNSLENQQLEQALRMFSSKRHTSLDFQSSVVLGSDKCFLGLEGNNDIKFTRIRTSFERMLPKLIISLPKDNAHNYYKFRLTFLSTIAFLFYSLVFVLSLVSLITSKTTIDKFGTVTLIYGVYLLLTLLEFKLTNSKLKKVIKMASLATSNG